MAFLLNTIVRNDPLLDDLESVRLCLYSTAWVERWCFASIYSAAFPQRGERPSESQHFEQLEIPSDEGLWQSVGKEAQPQREVSLAKKRGLERNADT